MNILQSLQPPNDTNKNGYSFFEVVITLTILSTLLFLSLPQFQETLERQETSLFLNRLSSDLHYAASEARSKMVIVRVDLLLNQRIYIVRVNGVLKKQVPFPRGKTIKSNFSNDRLDFFSDGQIGQAGTIDVVDKQGNGSRVVVQLSSGRFEIRSVKVGK